MIANHGTESEPSATVLVGPWRPRTADDRPSHAAELRTAMCTAPGHRSDTGISTRLVRIPILSAAETRVVVDLLCRLTDTHDADIGDLALEMADRLRDRLTL